MSAKTNGKETTFAVGQHVVYPIQGVGTIQEILEISFKGKDVLYYVIYIPVSDMTVKVPVDRAEQLGIRAIVPREESEKALAMFSEEFEPIPADWKMRYQMNLDLLKQGSVHDIASVVRTLYQRKKVKELPIMERKLYDSALQLFVDEVSFSLDIAPAEVEELVFRKLEEYAPGGSKASADVLPDEDLADDHEKDSGDILDDDE
ncbi:transcriptional regulator, CarD family [Alkalispirochaeta americana]|uniref:Transcriptional regulator, CarD family n=1 Tax=Alkalispirochaeta americana TaxID=159291 RepID=A0A1N6TX04_9SPIO|nr:CarD family transcriptional regulator [Alkalispirochaeta americana]SIQ57928.1 transcriptional regulator, CarD family [Alkalispirochaeta americana]